MIKEDFFLKTWEATKGIQTRQFNHIFRYSQITILPWQNGRSMQI